MAMVDCKECGQQVSTTADSCPHCGYVRRRRRGIFYYFGWGLLLLVGSCTALGVIGMNQRDPGVQTASKQAVSAPTAATSKAAYIEGATVTVGYTSYAVWKSWYSKHLSSNQFLDKEPNARWLFVELTVRNDDKKARMVPPLKLVDEGGAEYEADARGYMIEGAIELLETLNPSVSKQGTVVFDVPPGRSYKLKLDGGFWSTEDAYVKLEPK